MNLDHFVTVGILNLDHPKKWGIFVSDKHFEKVGHLKHLILVEHLTVVFSFSKSSLKHLRCTKIDRNP